MFTEKKSQEASKSSASKTALGSMGSDFTSPPKTKVSPAGSTSTWAARPGHFGKGQKTDGRSLIPRNV